MIIDLPSPTNIQQRETETREGVKIKRNWIIIKWKCPKDKTKTMHFREWKLNSCMLDVWRDGFFRIWSVHPNETWKIRHFSLFVLFLFGFVVDSFLYVCLASNQKKKRINLTTRPKKTKICHYCGSVRAIHWLSECNKSCYIYHKSQQLVGDTDLDWENLFGAFCL